MEQNGIVLILADAIFTFFLVHVTLRTGIDVVSELSLTATLPFNFNVYVSISICVLTLVFGVMSDSWSCVGRMGIVLMGIVSCFLSGLFLLFDQTSFLSSVPLIFYFAGSQVRNVFLLEQSHGLDFDEVKKFIFRLSYMRLWVRMFWAALDEKVLGRGIQFQLLFWGLVFFIFYYLTFTTFHKGLYYEPTYKWINIKILSCFARALFSRQKHVTYRKEEIVRGTLEVNKLYRPQFQKGQMVQKCLYGTLSAIVPYVNVYVIKETNYAVRLNHWLHRSSPSSSEYVIFQTLRLYVILPTVVLSSFFSHLSNTILFFTTSQRGLVKKTTLDVLDHFDVYTYFLFFQLMFFPLVEMLRPFVSKILKKDIYIFFLGYGLLLVSCTLMIILQAVIVPTLPYIPSALTSQVRLFNANNQTVYVATNHENVEHLIQPYDFRVFSDVPYSVKGLGWIKCDDKAPDITFHLERSETVSHVVKKCALYKRNSTDPNLFQLTDNSFHAIFYIVTAESVNGILVLRNLANPTSISVNLTQNFDKFYVTPGSYNLTFKLENSINVMLQNSLFVEGALYCLFIYKEEDTLNGKMVQVEGPLKYRFIYLLPQVVILALGHAFATVSFFRFLYLESPEKLRATLFSTVMTIELLIYCILQSFVPISINRYPYIIIILCGVHFAIFTVAIAFTGNLNLDYSSK